MRALVDVEVNSLQVNSGPDKRGVVVLGLHPNAKIIALFIQYLMRLAMQMKESPFYKFKSASLSVSSKNVLSLLK